MEAESHFRRRSYTPRLLPWAVVLLMLFASILVVRQYMPRIMEKMRRRSEFAAEPVAVESASTLKAATTNNTGDLHSRKGKVDGEDWGWKHLHTTHVPEVTSILGWESSRSRNTSMYIKLYDTTIIRGEKICRNDTHLVIIVTSPPSGFLGRDVIRQTWGSYNDSRVRIGFIAGRTPDDNVQQALEVEDEVFQDIIQDDFIDTYNNLTLKSIALLKWFIQNCPKASFLVKSDADTFVDVGLLVSLLPNHSTNGTLTGYLCPGCGIRRDWNLAWAVPRYMYSRTVYPNFLYGGGYVMSRDVALKLFAAAFRTPIIYLEDVYITGFCARAAGVVPTQFEGSSTYVWNVTKVCWPEMALCHPIYPDAMRLLWISRGLQKNDTVEFSQVHVEGFHGMRFISASNFLSINTRTMWIPLICALMKYKP